MLKDFKVNYEIIELMHFYWDSVSHKDKVIDSYFADVANRPEMEVLYNEDFTKESVRKVLSAINNRELMNGPTKTENRFWSMNMWMLEDIAVMQNMLMPVKRLDLKELCDEYSGDTMYEIIEVRFVPGHFDTYYINDNVLTINFFKLIPDFTDPSVITIEGKDLKAFTFEKAREMMNN